MEQIHGLGLARNIGVCNLACVAMMDLLSYATVKPHSNQVSLEGNLMDAINLHMYFVCRWSYILIFHNKCLSIFVALKASK